MHSDAPVIAKECLIRDLKALGLAPGDMVYVHTAMGKIGWIEGGAETLIDAFLAVLGPEGTLAAPTHTFAFVDTGAPPFAVNTTPTDLGKFPEALRQRKNALRSGHASHSSAAIGPRAAFLTENHDPSHALAEASPLHRLYTAGGKVLLLGVTHTRNTILHLAESLAGVPYTRLPYDASWGPSLHALDAQGQVRRYTQREFPGCSSGFDRIDPLLPKDSYTRGTVGNADAQLLAAGPLVDAAVAALRRDPGFFFCDADACPCCPPRIKMMAELSRHER